jgi:ribosomal protein S13
VEPLEGLMAAYNPSKSLDFSTEPLDDVDDITRQSVEKDVNLPSTLEKTRKLPTMRYFKKIDQRALLTPASFETVTDDNDCHNIKHESPKKEAFHHYHSEPEVTNIEDTEEGNADTDPTDAVVSDDDEFKRTTYSKISCKERDNLAVWACMRPLDTKDSNLNAHITDEFEKLVKRAEAEGEQWRKFSYRKAINILKRLDFKVKSAKDVSTIKGIGTQMSKKIDEIIRTGYTQKAKNLPEDYDLLMEFQQIYGVGDTIARKFIAKNYRSRQELLKYPKLTKDQKLGLKYYDVSLDKLQATVQSAKYNFMQDFIKRIPREECTQILHFVQDVVATKVDPGIECIMMGSYRRGATSCGDVDFILTHPNGHSHEGLLAKVLHPLRKEGFIVDDLSSPVGGDENQ